MIINKITTLNTQNTLFYTPETTIIKGVTTRYLESYYPITAPVKDVTTITTYIIYTYIYIYLLLLLKEKIINFPYRHISILGSNSSNTLYYQHSRVVTSNVTGSNRCNMSIIRDSKVKNTYVLTYVILKGIIRFIIAIFFCLLLLYKCILKPNNLLYRCHNRSKYFDSNIETTKDVKTAIISPKLNESLNDIKFIKKYIQNGLLGSYNGR